MNVFTLTYLFESIVQVLVSVLNSQVTGMSLITRLNQVLLYCFTIRNFNNRAHSFLKDLQHIWDSSGIAGVIAYHRVFPLLVCLLFYYTLTKPDCWSVGKWSYAFSKALQMRYRLCVVSCLIELSFSESNQAVTELGISNSHFNLSNETWLISIRYLYLVFRGGVTCTYLYRFESLIFSFVWHDISLTFCEKYTILHITWHNLHTTSLAKSWLARLNMSSFY